MNNPRLVLFLLRIGIASVFIYAGIASLLNPYNWIGFLPPQINNFIPAGQALFAIAVYQLILAAWLLSNKKVFYAAILSAITILGIIGVNLGALDITFRDFTIFFASLALAVGTYETVKK